MFIITSKERRLQLHELLCSVLGSGNVYYQPPENVKMKFPCVVYDLETIKTISADNIKYLTRRKYKVTVIDKNPDSLIMDRITKIPLCTFDRAYSINNLYHYCFTLVY